MELDFLVLGFFNIMFGMTFLTLHTFQVNKKKQLNKKKKNLCNRKFSGMLVTRNFFNDFV